MSTAPKKNDPPIDSPASLLTRGVGISELAQAIFKGDIPEQVLLELPAQSLYLAILVNGVESSKELIDLVSNEQYRIFLDFELWNRDRFDEERFWMWLFAVNEANTLAPLASFLNALDRDLLALVMLRYIEAISLEEPSDQPPQPGYFTPDQGYTWLAIKAEDADRHRMLGRLLALQFQESPDIFYQLLAASRYLTDVELEERSFAERERRLSDEGIPDRETSWTIHKTLHPATAKQMLLSSQTPLECSYNFRISPIVYERASIVPLHHLVSEVVAKNDPLLIERFERELSLITNAALIRNNVPLNDLDAVRFMIQQVRGAINLGLEEASALTPSTLWQVYETLGLQGLFQLGYYGLHELRNVAQHLSSGIGEKRSVTKAESVLLEGALAIFPYFPEFVLNEISGSAVEKEQQIGSCPFSHVVEVREVFRLLRERFEN